MFYLLIPILVLGGIFYLNHLAGVSLGKKKRCPYCNKTGMKAKGGSYYRNGIRGIDWECPHCGNRFFR